MRRTASSSRWSSYGRRPERRRSAALARQWVSWRSRTRSPREASVRARMVARPVRRLPGTYTTVRPEAAASARTAASVSGAWEPGRASMTRLRPVTTWSMTPCCAGSRSPTPRSASGARSKGLVAGRGAASSRLASMSPASAATTGCARRDCSMAARSSSSIWPGWRNGPTWIRSDISKSARCSRPSSANWVRVARGEKPCSVTDMAASASRSGEAPARCRAATNSGFTSIPGSSRSS